MLSLFVVQSLAHGKVGRSIPCTIQIEAFCLAGIYNEHTINRSSGQYNTVRISAILTVGEISC